LACLACGVIIRAFYKISRRWALDRAMVALLQLNV
jgi:hypothetical protein